jgi:branched-chain amino acid transport system ATP-binding protein
MSAPGDPDGIAASAHAAAPVDRIALDAVPVGTSAADVVAAAEHGLLEVRHLMKRFGGVRAVNALDMTVRAGDIHALIGPNGSGKTTTLNVISALYRADGGSIRFDGADIIGRPPHAIAKLGIARTFQNIRLFGDLSVVENVMIGRHVRTRTGFLGALIPGGATAREERQTRERAHELLEFVGLSGVGDASARSLPYGDQRRVEIARALASEPRLLLLDEPAAGMNPAETDTLVALLRRIREGGTTLLLIEHDMNLVMSVSDRITVLNFGQHIAEGSPDEIAHNRDVITAYLGGTLDAA